MTNTLQEFLVTATPKAAAALETALLRLPEDKRNWSPMGDARTALDMIAEVAMLNDIAEMVRNRAFPTDFDMDDYLEMKAALIGNWGKLQPLLHSSTAIAVETIATVPSEDLGIEIQMPWGPYSIAQIIAYPYWNMSYHEGQINYIASMLGCLDS